MKIVVTGGTGSVGSHVVRELLARGADVTVPTRSEEKVASLPDGVTGVVGDLASPDTVRRIFKGADAMFLLNTVSPTELHEGLMALNGAMESGVRRVVYLSIQDVEKLPKAPHFGAKIPIELALERSDLEWTVLRPNNFYQNDLWFQEALTSYGVYPQPLGSQGLSRVDVRDIAEAAAVALTEDGHDGETYDLVGPDVWTGEGTAALWGDVMGREIAYGGDDLDAWEQQSLAFLPDWMVYDFRIMYAYFQREGLRAPDGALSRQESLIGHPARGYADFVRETVAAWGGGGSA